MKKNYFFLIICIFQLFITTSCFLRKDNSEIILPQTDFLAIGEKWAVIEDPYASFYEDADYDSLIVGHARRADILKVTGRKFNKAKAGEKIVLWYRFEEGWIEESSLQYFDNYLKATTVANNLK